MDSSAAASEPETRRDKRDLSDGSVPGTARHSEDRKPQQPEAGRNAVQQLTARLCRDRFTRLALTLLDQWKEIHLKELRVEKADDQRRIRIAGRWLCNFGSDSFLGLDRDPRVQRAIATAVKQWGTHNGASRAFAAVELCWEAERRLAKWLGVEDTLIFPSVTLANVGLLPALVGKGDLLVVDRRSHDSIQQAAKIASANGAVLKELHPCCAEALDGLLREQRPEGCLVAVDGVYSMTGEVPPLASLSETAGEHGAVLYVDDAHGTGVVGPSGRGAASAAIGSLDRILMVGSLSKAFSCMGAFVTCTPQLKKLLKIRSSTFIFGGPVPPPYLAAVCKVCEILDSPEYDTILGRLRGLVQRLLDGLRGIGLTVLGGEAAIVSIVIGDIERTFEAGKWLFDRGFYVQSATYPAVAINGGLLRIQVNANHSVEAIDGLVSALADLADAFDLRAKSRA